MGLFNTIFADLECPKCYEIAHNSEIQIKWQEYKFSNLNVYHIGSELENIDDEYNNTWIRTDYVCTVCSNCTEGKSNIDYIKTEDQSRHYVFVKVEDGRIFEILTEQEFREHGVDEFVDYW